MPRPSIVLVGVGELVERDKRFRVAGEAVCSSELINLLAGLDECFTRLSPKEHEILRSFVSGLSVNEIAQKLNRSAKTISTPKISAVRKL